jgi:putative membrane protein
LDVRLAKAVTPNVRRKVHAPEGEPMASYLNLLRGLHILAVIAWMAGMLYLPRLFVYHTRAIPGGELDVTLKEMEAKLMQIIVNPSMIATLLLGLSLVWIDSGLRGWDFLIKPWMLSKLAGLLVLFGWHGFLSASQKKFERGANVRSEKFWRMTNEIPFLAAIVIVLSVTTKFLD